MTQSWTRRAADRRVLISADTDFGAILAQRRADNPSVLLIRRAVEQGQLILKNLDQVAGDLDTGAIVVLSERSLRIRKLPIVT